MSQPSCGGAEGQGEVDARLIIASSEVDADLYYATHFLAPDPFIYLEVKGQRLLLMSDLEIDRARAQAEVDMVLSYSSYESKVQAQAAGSTPESPSLTEVLSVLLEERGVRRLLVPASCGIQHVEELRAKGFSVQFTKDPFFPERLFKTEEEIGQITVTLRHTEAALEAAIAAIRTSQIRGGELYLDGVPLTSEAIRRIINLHLMEKECVARHTIVSCGLDACDPHHEGSGPLRPHQPIILDVFPQSERSRYFADITRTVVRGQASPALQALHAAVQQGQEEAFRRIRHGVDGAEVHGAVMSCFERLGYRTGLQDGRMQGFFHGTGHGLGLEVHEPPRISKVHQTLQAGQVVTVEPGLYYREVGAVRIEDLLVVTEEGCRNLTRFPKVLEV